MLRTLVANRCVTVEGRVLRVVTRRTVEGDVKVVEARAVVLVDVYLPVAAWSGWQFPRSRTTAAAVFKHVRKWRKLSDGTILNSTSAWFCSMNPDPARQKCTISEESWDLKEKITNLPGFYKKGTLPGNEENVSFFANILKDNVAMINSETKKALIWLANLPVKKHLEMESVGLTRPVLDTRATIGKGARPYFKIFQALGLVRKIEKGVTRWYYPSMLEDLAFDSAALGLALEKPLDLVRYSGMSPQTPLMFMCGGDHKKPSAHSLAWDYDIVITTFSRLSAEWDPRKRSPLKQIHWFRVILDEGHTLGSSLALTNKLQMAVSLVASNRWILTGTPTPNTPTSQVAHLHPMLKFLHDEVYGENYQSWDSGIHRPFEAQMEEGQAGQDIQETMDALVQQGLDPSSEEYQFIRHALLNGASCARCKGWCRLPVITPCQHLLCLDCVALDCERCTLPGCGNHYEMQSPESRKKSTENPNPKWPVPKDLIELQPSYKQDDWDPDWQSTSSSKVAYLIEKLKNLRERDMKYMNSTNMTSSAGSSSAPSCQPQAKLDKVIIFSQFLEHIHVIQQQLAIAGITYAGMYSPMPLGSKRSALAKFQDDPTCMALVMDGTAALGLDLSFVTYVFLMEPIWDRR
ncbi:hypothetical protein PR202_ga08290 [Eleusine coracana subsp. coracana]|uniref:Uncharacterized protein n=1 Tax=Eleusine coracana subsp. coracana TaxID=191504 RepID=A0AAV5C291_ELECO|nr:hypothetical protein PR202_ga08290 [Eleusine coracana subsp. coracana]